VPGRLIDHVRLFPARPPLDRSARPPLDRRIAELAEAQHGVITVAQLDALGLGRRGVAHRARTGRLHRLHRGVYSVGTTLLSTEGRWMAAVLACGEGAALSHGSAAALWEIRGSTSGPVDVTVRSRAGRSRRKGLRIHRPVSLREREIVSRHRIPVTTPARTLLDLAGTLPRASLRRAIAQAEALRIFDLRALQRVLDRNGSCKGAGILAAMIKDWADVELTRSELEALFLELCASEGIPRPATNALVGKYEVDFLWPSHRVIVEVDGHQHHGTRTAFERDRLRDARLTVAGYRVVRFTYRQVVRDPGHVAAVLRSLLR
jgi:predicted transcriptional regulator of viral defense system